MAAIPARIASIPETSKVSFPRTDGDALLGEVEPPVSILSINPLLKQGPCEHLQQPRVTPTPNLSRVNSFQSGGTAQQGSAMDPSFSANLICKLDIIREPDVVQQSQQQEDLNTAFQWKALIMSPQRCAGPQTFVSSWCCAQTFTDKSTQQPSNNDGELHPSEFQTSKDEVKPTDEDNALCSKF